MNVYMGVTNSSFAVVGVVSGDPAGASVFHLQLVQYLNSASTFSPHPTLVVVYLGPLVTLLLLSWLLSQLCTYFSVSYIFSGILLENVPKYSPANLPTASQHLINY